jgi:hypothetical protein
MFVDNGVVSIKDEELEAKEKLEASSIVLSGVGVLFLKYPLVDVMVGGLRKLESKNSGISWELFMILN